MKSETLVRKPVAIVFVVILFVLGFAAHSDAVHFYRGPGGECSPASGELTDDPDTSGDGKADSGPVEAEVVVLHNTFHDASSGTPVTRIEVGEAVRWNWNSSHCHSVRGSDGSFYSGFHYPEESPDSPEVAPGLFHYPVPDPSPTLSYVHTFEEPGKFLYDCEHHGQAGMQGLVIVEPRMSPCAGTNGECTDESDGTDPNTGCHDARVLFDVDGKGCWSDASGQTCGGGNALTATGCICVDGECVCNGLGPPTDDPAGGTPNPMPCTVKECAAAAAIGCQQP